MSARWGTGKTFLIESLKKEFDTTVYQDPITRELKQRFHYGEKAADSAPFIFDTKGTSKNLNVMNSYSIFDFFYSIVCFCYQQSFETFGQFFDYVTNILANFSRGAFSSCRWLIMNRVYSSYTLQAFAQVVRDQNRPYYEFFIAPFIPLPSETSNERFSDLPPEVEYIFIDFSAWEFCATDELWAGMIRNLYRSVERRMEFQKMEGASRVDLKMKWRTEDAIQRLMETFGSKQDINHLLNVITGILLSFILLTILIMLDLVDFFYWLKYVWPLIVYFIPSTYSAVGLVLHTYYLVSISRGDVIYQDAIAALDKIGFMATVKAELMRLFDFINKAFVKETGIQLRLLLFIDDLDRCLEGRNVKMLEAIQLLLNVPGAPVIVFLAIDSRIVVASIEHVLSKSIKFENAMITGWEYLEKIIQIPFCLPEMSNEKVRRFVSAVVKNGLTLSAVEALIGRFFDACYTHKETRRPKGMAGFELWCSFPSNGSTSKLLHIPFREIEDTLREINPTDARRKLQCLSEMIGCHTNSFGTPLLDLDAEGEEMLCQAIELALSNVKFAFAKTRAKEDDEDLLAPDCDLSQHSVKTIVPRFKPPFRNIPADEVNITYKSKYGKVYEGELFKFENESPLSGKKGKLIFFDSEFR